MAAHNNYDVKIKGSMDSDIVIVPSIIAAGLLNIDNKNSSKGELTTSVTVSIRGGASVTIVNAPVEIDNDTYAYGQQFNKTVTIIPNEELTKLLANDRATKEAARAAYLATPEGIAKSAATAERLQAFYGAIRKRREMNEALKNKPKRCTILGGTRRRSKRRRSKRLRR